MLEEVFKKNCYDGHIWNLQGLSCALHAFWLNLRTKIVKVFKMQSSKRFTYLPKQTFEKQDASPDRRE